MGKIILLINHFIGKLSFLSGNSLSSTAQSLGIQTADTSQIGHTIIPAIEKITQLVTLISAVGVISLIAVLIIVSKKQETRSESMMRIIWVCGGIFLGCFAVGLVGWFAATVA